MLRSNLEAAVVPAQLLYEGHQRIGVVHVRDDVSEGGQQPVALTAHRGGEHCAQLRIETEQGGVEVCCRLFAQRSYLCPACFERCDVHYLPASTPDRSAVTISEATPRRIPS